MFSVLIHEAVHIFQAKEVYSICYNVGDTKHIGYVHGDFNGKSSLELELPAYIVTVIVFITLILMLTSDFKERLNN